MAEPYFSEQEQEVIRKARLNGDQQFVLMNKATETLRVVQLTPDGLPLVVMTAPAVSGKSTADILTAAIIKTKIEDTGKLPDSEKITPAGRWTVSSFNAGTAAAPDQRLGADSFTGSTAGHGWAISIGSTVDSQNKLTQLSPADRHVDGIGTIGLDHDSMTKLLSVVGGNQTYPLYILPETQTVKAVQAAPSPAGGFYNLQGVLTEQLLDASRPSDTASASDTGSQPHIIDLAFQKWRHQYTANTPRHAAAQAAYAAQGTRIDTDYNALPPSQKPLVDAALKVLLKEGHYPIRINNAHTTAVAIAKSDAADAARAAAAPPPSPAKPADPAVAPPPAALAAPPDISGDAAPQPEHHHKSLLGGLVSGLMGAFKGHGEKFKLNIDTKNMLKDVAHKAQGQDSINLAFVGGQSTDSRIRSAEQWAIRKELWHNGFKGDVTFSNQSPTASASHAGGAQGDTLLGDYKGKFGGTMLMKGEQSAAPAPGTRSSADATAADRLNTSAAGAKSERRLVAPTPGMGGR